jgi:UDP-N-acetylmuramyl tripeptide synthase
MGFIKKKFALQGGVFTNLSHDHLDYHPTFAEYRDVKKSFLTIFLKMLLY